MNARNSSAIDKRGGTNRTHPSPIQLWATFSRSSGQPVDAGPEKIATQDERDRNHHRALVSLQPSGGGVEPRRRPYREDNGRNQEQLRSQHIEREGDKALRRCERRL